MMPLLEAAAEEMAAHPGPGLVAVLTEIAWTMSSYDQTDESRPSLERAEEAADDAGVPRPHRLLEIRGSMEIALGDHAAGVRHMREAAERSLADGEAQTAALILNDIGSVEQGYGTMVDALAACDEAIAIVTERGIDPTIGQSVRMRVLFHIGRWDEVVEQTPALIDIAMERANVWIADGLRMSLARVLLDRGWLDRIDTEAFEPANFSVRSDAMLWTIHLRTRGARNELVDLDPIQALIVADEMYPTPPLLDALLRLGDIGTAERYRQAFTAPPYWLAWVDGLLHEARGKTAEAEVELRIALDAAGAIGSKSIQADLLFHLGRCSIALGEREMALERLQRSRELWTSMGANVRVAEVDEVLASL